MINIIDLQLFPSINYIKNLLDCTNITIELFEFTQKMRIRNRYIISGSNGLIALTVPISGGRNQKALYKDTKIDFSEDWQTKHWKTLQSSYNKSPFFEYYAPDLKNIFFSKEEYLVSFNYKMLDWIIKVLKINVLVFFSEFYLERSKSILDLRNNFLPNEVVVEENNWKPRYPQVFQDRFGFLPNLSILDMLFCVGPNTINLLKNNC